VNNIHSPGALYPMIGSIRQTLIALLATAVISPLQADTSVWKVSKGNRHLYLGGTIHVLSKNDYPLQASFEKAYHLSHRVESF